jgi:hypothetical protein
MFNDPFDIMLKLAYFTVEHDSHLDEAATLHGGFAECTARTAGRGLRTRLDYRHAQTPFEPETTYPGSERDGAACCRSPLKRGGATEQREEASSSTPSSPSPRDGTRTGRTVIISRDSVIST